MKNIIEFNHNGIRCTGCNISGFFNWTPNGGDYITCPLCNSGSQYIEMDNPEYEPNHDFDYCTKCNILYCIGCVHSVAGCSDNTFNGHLIGKWKYDGNVYVGMPCFDNLDEYLEKYKNIEILEEICPNNGIQCENSFYSKDEFPEYYDNCVLKK